MTPTVFFSWQSDSPQKRNTEFIRSALEAAVQNVAVVELPLRVDAAAEGLAGTPDIPSTIFHKLTQTAVAVFDITPVGKAERTGKALPNPNVLLELGFATSLIGWDRIILVMNTADGYQPEHLPFDLRHRRFPVRYKAATGEEEGQRQGLITHFKDYIPMALETTHLALERARRRLSRDCPFFIENFGKQESFHWPQNDLKEELHRLLDLEFINYNLNPSVGLYSYHWTYLGQELCKWYFAQKAKTG
jgi:hypothetical protein